MCTAAVNMYDFFLCTNSDYSCSQQRRPVKIKTRMNPGMRTASSRIKKFLKRAARPVFLPLQLQRN